MLLHRLMKVALQGQGLDNIISYSFWYYNPLLECFCRTGVYIVNYGKVLVSWSVLFSGSKHCWITLSLPSGHVSLWGREDLEEMSLVCREDQDWLVRGVVLDRAGAI